MRWRSTKQSFSNFSVNLSVNADSFFHHESLKLGELHFLSHVSPDPDQVISDGEFGCVIGHPKPSVAYTTTRLAPRVRRFLSRGALENASSTPAATAANRY